MARQMLTTDRSRTVTTVPNPPRMEKIVNDASEVVEHQNQWNDPGPALRKLSAHQPHDVRMAFGFAVEPDEKGRPRSPAERREEKRVGCCVASPAEARLQSKSSRLPTDLRQSRIVPSTTIHDHGHHDVPVGMKGEQQAESSGE